jgi:toxin FitB
MYLIDTNVISEMRKGINANLGVQKFFQEADKNKIGCYLSVITLGEIRCGIDLIHHRKDHIQAHILEKWLNELLIYYTNNILAFEPEAAQLWGRLRVPHAENSIDKQIAATALIHNLTLVTRNTKDFVKTGTRLFNPFSD